VHTDESLHLLATCHYRAGNKVSAYSLLRSHGCRLPQSRFLLARCCLDLRKFSEAEVALDGDTSLSTRTSAKAGLDEMAGTFGDSASFALALVGQLCSRTERSTRATEAFRKSLKLNPFLWSSYESLVNLGDTPNPAEIFSVSSLDNFNQCQGSNPLVNFVNKTNIDFVTEDIKAISIFWFQTVASQGMCQSKLSVLPLPCDASPTVQAPLSVVRSGCVTPQGVGIAECTHLGAFTPDLGCEALLTAVKAPAKQLLSSVKGVRSALGGVSTLSPLSASFGVLPLTTSGLGTPSTGSITGMLAYVTPTSQNILESIVKEPCPAIKKNLSRKPQGLNTAKVQIFSQSSNNNVLQTPTVAGFPSSGLSSVRRSSRLFSSSNSVKENNKGSSSPKALRGLAAKSPSSKKTKPSRGALRGSGPPNTPAGATPGLVVASGGVVGESEFNELNKMEPPPALSLAQTVLSMQRASAEGLMELLQDLGRAQLYLGQYRVKQAIETLQDLPPHQYTTGWVLAALGRAYFELGEYDKAVRVFEELRTLEPYRLEGLEYYSTCLWHLQREVHLSALAQELMDLDKNAATASTSPFTTCAVAGNCFSLQREHETAVKFLQRAVQVDPDFTYAYTLLGYELVSVEEVDKGLASFRNAILVDPRHYNAWFGAGMIYYKQQQFLLAEMHFKRALNINPQSSVLLCHIAVVQHALKKTEMSLATLNSAMAMEPRNPLCKFHRASIYFSLDRYQEALEELDELKQMVPKESLVYFLCGKVHKKLGNTHLALMNFSWAMDLDPKGANNQIKESIDKRGSAEDEDNDASLLSADANAATQHSLPVDDSGSVGSGAIDPDSSHGSSVADFNDMHLQSMESDEGF
ncbi:unnamed protein product, partial [Ixodes hexagonus]